VSEQGPAEEPERQQPAEAAGEPQAAVGEPPAEAEAQEPPAEAEAQEPPAEAEAQEPGATPTRRPERKQDGEQARRPVVRAQAKYVRSSPRKARLVCDHIRGKTVEEARAILAHTPRAVARDWSKLLESAVANAEHNHELVGEDLYVKAVRADEGPTIKRFRPRARGRADRIRKRTSHLTILLTPKE
jgi:ribosomal protein L22